MHTEKAMRAVYAILMVVVGFVILVPVLALIFGSFWSASPVAAGHVTLANWIRAVTIRIPADIPTLVFNSLVFAFVTAAISVVLGVTMAFLVVRTDMPYGRVLRQARDRAAGLSHHHRGAGMDPAAEPPHRGPQRHVPGGLRHQPVQHLFVSGDDLPHGAVRVPHRVPHRHERFPSHGSVAGRTVHRLRQYRQRNTSPGDPARAEAADPLFVPAGVRHRADHAGSAHPHRRPRRHLRIHLGHLQPHRLGLPVADLLQHRRGAGHDGHPRQSALAAPVPSSRAACGELRHGHRQGPARERPLPGPVALRGVGVLLALLRRGDRAAGAGDPAALLFPVRGVPPACTC